MKISVAMCTYNGASFLDEQMASLATQSRKPDEVVICDDRSTDETIGVVERWARNAPFRVEIHLNDHRLGSTKNFEKAISLCTGDLIALSDQDDVWLDHKLYQAEQAFTADPRLGCWFTDAELVDERLQPLGRTMWQSLGLDRSLQRKLRQRDAVALLLKKRLVTGATMVFAARLRPYLLPIPTGFSSMIHDGWIATVSAAVSPLGLSETPSVLYRQHTAQQIGAKPKRSAGVQLVERVPKLAGAIEEDLAILRAVDERTRQAGGGTERAEARQALDERLDLLVTRSALPKEPWRRFRVVGTALASGQYHRHAQGFASAIKDLLN